MSVKKVIGIKSIWRRAKRASPSPLSLTMNMASGLNQLSEGKNWAYSKLRTYKEIKAFNYLQSTN